ncbi:P-loop containing nucleoside triphosphate hydrolase protein [Rhodofomes roseus]|uniref:P-loop containing nucleoside triphosphate hydrolase protein n=1 Tax=Rhodofomes roseus TaxID=34475 RepID=A0ABQ8KYJ3_9APHY|nr:P-loop containing nucleoside triphosphate hydrolase protein [Rhodofomes roseus]KAH9843831.1 P-loop containing nucleoside triphosphate hydrolase protein [Rhodofomes roseus]
MTSGERKHAALRAKLRLRPALSQGSEATPSSSQATTEGQSRDDPIIVDCSPIRPMNVNRVSDKPFYSIFAPKKASPVISAPSDLSTRASSPPKRLNKHGMIVPYPPRDSQHIRANQTNFSTSPCPFERRLQNSRSSSQAQLPSQDEHTTAYCQAQGSEPLRNGVRSAGRTDDFARNERGRTVVNGSSAPCDPSSASHIVNDIPATHKSYPAIERLVDRIQSDHHDEADSSPPSQELWIDKWRPRRADEVLGNEDRALYLRAWLLALKLHIESTPASSQASRGSEGSGKRRQPAAKPRGTKRPQVVRQVDRRRKRRRLDSEEPDDSWIVDDEWDDDPEVDNAHYGAGGGDELAFCQQPYSRLRRVAEEVEAPPCLDPPATTADTEKDKVAEFSPRSPQFGNQIHNTILLSGPSGCGKTSAVYACAEELGWDVFEVYPGIGERSGAALNKLVGDVGKNHIVKQTQRQQKSIFGGTIAVQDPHAPRNGGATQKAGGRKRVLKRVDSENDLDGEGQSQTEPTASAAPSTLPSEHPPVSQSIVLIEEVDVLYDSDANFWPSLINIIKECRRPVVMTCNDPSLVPIADLPLQDILFFSPAVPALATSYLQCVALLAQRPLERSTISRLYERGADAPCGYTGGSSTDPPARYPDLRQSLLQLQFGDPDIPTDSPAESASAEERVPHSHVPSSLDVPLEAAQEDLRIVHGLDKLDKLYNNLSFADCHLHRKQLDDLVDTMTADSGAANDELGYRVLHNDASTASLAPINTSFYHQDEAVMEFLLSSWQNLCAPVCSIPTELHGGGIPSGELATQMVSVLQETEVPSDTLANSSAVYLDYGPWLRHMVNLDDAVEANYLESQAGKDEVRKTRNSLKSVRPVRYVLISESNRRTLTHTALRN